MTCPLENMQNVNNFIMKIACYCLFNTVLNKMSHNRCLYILHNTITEFIKMTPFKPLNLNTVCRFLMIHDSFWFMIAFHESRVGPEQFNCSHNALRARGCKLLNWMIRVNCTYFVFWETFKYVCNFLSAVPNEKIWYLKKIRKINIILFKSLHPLALNASCCLPEHL